MAQLAVLEPLAGRRRSVVLLLRKAAVVVPPVELSALAVLATMAAQLSHTAAVVAVAVISSGVPLSVELAGAVVLVLASTAAKVAETAEAAARLSRPPVKVDSALEAAGKAVLLVLEPRVLAPIPATARL